MCSYWLRTWRPIKKTPYVIFYCLSFKIILCMFTLWPGSVLVGVPQGSILGHYYSFCLLTIFQIQRYVHAGNFRLFFSQYSGLKFPAVFLQKIEIFAFYRLLNILCAVSADNRRPHEWEKISRKWPTWLQYTKVCWWHSSIFLGKRSEWYWKVLK